MTGGEREQLKQLINLRRRGLVERKPHKARSGRPARGTKDPSRPDFPWHGTSTGYRYACRCESCREAHRLAYHGVAA